MASNRVSSIDALRGLSILAMVFCSTIGWNSNLPAWMFHCQVPPPSYVFDPSVKGITWVDLVFPFFLFSLGAALPFSLGGKLRRGESTLSVALTSVRRWVIVATFAVLLGNSNAIYYNADVDAVIRYPFRFAVWAGYFMALVRIKDPKKGLIVNLCGAALLIAAFVTGFSLTGLSFSVHRIDIIIMVMSSMVLFGGWIWLLTRNHMWIRCIIFALIVAFKAGSSYIPDFLPFMNIPDQLSWLLNWRYMQYLGIVVPASMVGDLIVKRGTAQAAEHTIPSLIALGMIPLALWGFFTRNVLLLGILVAAFAIIYTLLTFKKVDTRVLIGYIGFALLMLGIGFDPLDGGITKDHCNLSYLFGAGGLAALCTSFFLWLESVSGSAGKVLPLLGQNPMIAYTVSGYVIIPLLTLVGFVDWIDQFTIGNPFIGIVHGVVFVSLMALCTCLFTKNKIFWRS